MFYKSCLRLFAQIESCVFYKIGLFSFAQIESCVFYKIGLCLFAQIESLQFFVAFLLFVCCVITKTNVVRIVINRKIVINTICPIDNTFPKKAYMNKNNEIYNILILSD